MARAGLCPDAFLRQREDPGGQAARERTVRPQRASTAGDKEELDWQWTELHYNWQRTVPQRPASGGPSHLSLRLYLSSARHGGLICPGFKTEIRGSPVPPPRPGKQTMLARVAKHEASSSPQKSRLPPSLPASQQESRGNPVSTRWLWKCAKAGLTVKASSLLTENPPRNRSPDTTSVHSITQLYPLPSLLRGSVPT